MKENELKIEKVSEFCEENDGKYSDFSIENQKKKFFHRL